LNESTKDATMKRERVDWFDWKKEFPSQESRQLFSLQSQNIFWVHVKYIYFVGLLYQWMDCRKWEIHFDKRLCFACEKETKRIHSVCVYARMWKTHAHIYIYILWKILTSQW